MEMKKVGNRIRNLMILCGILLAVCVFPKSVLASVLDNYGDGKVYDVTAYGADKTGASSSSTAVTNAVNAAKKDAAKGNMDGKSRAVIYFPSGTYRLDSFFKIYSNTVIAAESDTVIQASSNAVDIIDRKNTVVDGGIWKSSGKTYVIKSTRSEITVKNITISQGATGLLMNTSTASVENVTVSGCSEVGIQNTKGPVTLKKIKVSDCKTGIAVFSSTATMNDITVTGCTNLGMNISLKTQATASNLTVTGNGNGYPQSGYLGHGIGVYGNSKFIVSNSNINSNRECGISLSAGNAEIKNCTMQNNGRHAVGTDKVCSLKMTSCKVDKNGWQDDHDGILVVMGSKATITNCTITSSAASGLLVHGGGTNVTVKNCTFKGNKAHNIYVENVGTGKVKLTVNGGKFYKCTTSDSIRVHVNKTSQYSLKLKGSIKYYNKLKKGYELWMGNSVVHKSK